MTGDIERYCLRYGVWAKEPLRRSVEDRASVLLASHDDTDTRTVMSALNVSANSAVKALLSNGYLLVEGDILSNGRWEYVPQFGGKVEYIDTPRRDSDGRKVVNTPKVRRVAATAEEWWDLDITDYLDPSRIEAAKSLGLELRVQARRMS